MRSNEEIQNLIGQVRDFNTEQRVASENNKPVKQKIERSLANFDSPTLKEHPKMQEYITEINALVKEIRKLIDVKPTTNIKKALEEKERLVNKIASLVEDMYNQMEGELRESQN